MAEKIRGDRGLFAPVSGVARFTAKESQVFSFRAAGDYVRILRSMNSGDRGDFLRAAIAEKLERDQVLSNQEI